MDSKLGFSGLPARKGRPLLERLMERTIPVPWSGCLLWTGGMVGNYGLAFLPGGRPTTAHRAMMIAKGYDLSDEENVCHRCDVTLCVEFDHLFVGTQADNMADMHSKGRHKPSYSIQPEWRAKIRNDDTPAWAVAAWFDVSNKTITNIRRGM